jgi:hypothetical protein
MKRTLLFVVLLAACPKPKEDLGTPGVSKHNDKCTILPHHCPGGADDDGCPGVIIEVGDSCALSAKGVADLNAVSDELLNERDLTRITVTSPSMTCSNIARAHLEQRGVPDWRIHVAQADNRSFISFEIDAYKEKLCRDGSPVKPPGGSVY